ncbi:MAG: SpoIIE family protein phosphatase [Acidobacteriota bacterium]
MRIRTLDELLLLPEETAVTRQFDGVNWVRFRWILGFAFFASVIIALEGGGTGARLRLWVGVANVALLAGFFFIRRTRSVEEGFRWILVALVALELAGLALLTTEAEALAAVVAAVLTLLLLLLRLRPAQAFTLCAFAAATTLVWHLGHGATFERASLWAFGLSVPAVLAASLTVRITRARRKEFVDRWRRAATRERERLRMRGELADARKIQLSMLPAGDPQVDWLDLSGVCLPAVEVGGDYFDYIELADGAYALVMADVAGHGVASGLQIAGLRSSLYVLQDELRSPARVLEKLNMMVRASVRHRTFITVSVAVVERLDGGRGRVRVASAGHPPVLLWRAEDSSVRELGPEAPPLGTRLPSRYDEESARLGPGDLLLLYTDGLVETVDFRTDAFGFDRLARALAKAAEEDTVRDVRNDLLDSISRFKGETLQADDLSIVVARFRGEPDAGAEERRAATG